MEHHEELEYIRKTDVMNLYHLNKSSFPSEIVDTIEKNYNTFDFTFNVIIPFFCDAPDKVRELMMKQFPAFRKENRPTLVKDIQSIINAAGVDLVIALCALMQAKMEGKTARDLYKPFDEWIEKNTYPEDRWEEVDDRDRMSYGAWDCTKKEWEKIKKEENAFRQKEMEWLKQRRFEFIDLLQGVLLEHFKGFELLDSDDLQVYSLLLRREYEDYNDYCLMIEDFIDWGLPEEDYKSDYSERSKKMVAMGNEKRWEVAELQYRRVNGEEI
jgi:hypothetical protein